MSKKKISQIVGLTIGATAIASAGIGSSIALTSCTAPVEVNSNIVLNLSQIQSAFSAVQQSLDNLGYDAIVKPGNLDTPLIQSVIKGNIATALNNVPGFNQNNINKINVVTSQATNEAQYPTEVTVTSISITFTNDVTLPSDLGSSGLSVDSSNPMMLTDSNVNATYANPSLVSLDNQQYQSIYQAVQAWTNSLKDSNYTNSDVNGLNSPTNKETVLGAIASASGINRSDLNTINFNVTTSQGSGQYLTVGINFDLSFQPNVMLANTDNTYFEVNQTKSQTLSTKQAISQQILNPNFNGLVLYGSSGDAIYSALKTSLGAVSKQNFTSAYLNGASFKSLVQTNILKSGVNLNDAAFKSLAFTLSDADSTNPNASIGVNLGFTDNVSFDKWDNNPYFDANNSTHSLVTKSDQAIVIANPLFDKVSVDASQATSLYNGVVDAVKALSADQINPTYLNTTFQAQAKSAVVTSLNNPQLEPYLESIDFTVNDVDGNRAYQNLSFAINFDSNVNVSAGNWNQFVLLTNSDQSQTLRLIQPAVIDNKSFSPSVLDASSVSKVYQSIESQIIALSQQPNFSVDQLVHPSDSFIQTIKQELVKSLADLKVQLGDIQNLSFVPTIDQADDTKLDVNFSVNFGPNVQIGSGLTGDLVNGASANTLVSKRAVQVNNPTNNIPAKPSLDASNLKAISSLLTTSLNKLEPDSFASVATNNTFIDGLKSQIASQLTKDGVKNFSVHSIQTISLSVAQDAATNILSIQPVIQFQPQVNLSAISAGTPEFSVDTSTNSLSAKTPISKQAAGAFVSQALVNSFNANLKTQLQALYDSNANNINQAYLNTASVLDSIKQKLVQDPSFANSNLSSGDFSLSFTVTQSQTCSATVSYQVVFANSVTLASPILNGDNLTISADTKTISSVTPFSFGNNLILTSDGLNLVYSDIQSLIPTNNLSQINPTYLDGLASDITTKVNQSLQPKDNTQVIKAISFKVDYATNNVIASVTFNDGLDISASIDNPSISATANHQYQMMFAVPNLSSYVSNDSLVQLQTTVETWVNSFNIVDVTKANLDANINSGLKEQLKGAGFNPSWLDFSNTSFTVNLDQNNNVIFNTKFVDGTQFENPQAPNLTGMDYSYTFSPSKNLGSVLTDSRFQALNQAIKDQITTEYTPLFQANNLNQLTNNLMAKSGDILAKVQASTGLDTSLIDPLKFNS